MKALSVGLPGLEKSNLTPRYYLTIGLLVLQEMFEFVREVDNNRDLYLKWLAAPWYRDNQVPDYAREDTSLAFFTRIAEAVLSRR